LSSDTWPGCLFFHSFAFIPDQSLLSTFYFSFQVGCAFTITFVLEILTIAYISFSKPLSHSLNMFAKLFKIAAAATMVASVMATPLPSQESTDLGVHNPYWKQQNI
jgi:hypothetical protein